MTNYVCCIQYLGNHISYYHHLSYTSDFLGLLGGSKGKKWPKMTKKLSFALTSQEPYITWSWSMVHMCKKIISPGVFLPFFQILIFKVNSEVEEQLMSVTLHIWVTYMVWLCFFLHKFKVVTSQDAFFIFSKFRFSDLLRRG